MIVPKLAPGAVTSAVISNGSITSDKIANSAVTSTKITDEAVTTAKLAPGAITSDVISNGSITSDKIANGAITGAKISGYNATHGGTFLRKDGAWVVPPDTTYSEMSGTTLGLVKLNGSYTFTSTINVPTPSLPS